MTALVSFLETLHRRIAGCAERSGEHPLAMSDYQ